MTRWELTKFKVEKNSEGLLTPVLSFEAEIIIPEAYKSFTFIYNGKQLTVNGSEVKPEYLAFEIKLKLESLLSSSLIRELSKHSRKAEYLRSFSLRKISVYAEGTLANLRYVYNDKFLEFGSVLVIPPYKDWGKLCKVPLTIKTNAVSNVKSFYELLAEICRSAVNVYININTVNEILKVLLKEIGV